MTNFGFVVLPPDLNNSSPCPESWLAAKRKADSCDGETFSCSEDSSTWRLHDDLYDLTSFVEKHPGGRDWILMTRGTDITEMFESHHPNIEKARKFLKKYVIKSEKPLPPRNSGRFSFHPNGFYSTLRARAWNEVLQHTGTGPTAVMLLLHTTLLIMYLSFLFSVPFLTKFQNDSPDTPERRSLVFELVSLPQFYVNTAMSGVVLALLMICSHNFFHQRDNWRMYAFDLSSFSSYDWRITHAYSHHTFPNTSYDYEVSTTANILNFYPYKFPSMEFTTAKNKPFAIVLFQRVIQVLLLQIMFLIAMNASILRRLQLLISGGSKFRVENLLPVLSFLCLVLLYALSESIQNRSWEGVFIVVANLNMSEIFLASCFTYGCSFAVSSWAFLTISLAAGHHHPDCWHDGDDFEVQTATKKVLKPTNKINSDVDWGIFQLAAVGDRPNVDSSTVLASVTFGMHTLHHLFPTVDHSKLGMLLPCFRKTCSEFDVRFFVPSSSVTKEKINGDGNLPMEPERSFTIVESWIGMWQQLWRNCSSNRNFVTWRE